MRSRTTAAASAEPAMEESASFDSVVDIVSSGDYDYYIYDLVPLGHTLYYLSMAKVYDEWISKITHLREEMREYEEMVSRIRREKETAEDQILTELQDIRSRINTASRVLTDREWTAFFFVVVPEGDDPARHGEGRRDVRPVRCAPRRLRGEPGPPRRIAVGRRCTPYLINRLEMQRRHLGNIRRDLGDEVLAYVPELERDVTGLAMIERMARMMYGDGQEGGA